MAARRGRQDRLSLTKTAPPRKLSPHSFSQGYGMNGQDMNLPEDFRPVDGCVPEWIDIREICADAQRFVGIYALTNVDAVAINNGRAIFTTSDRNGEFRETFKRIVDQIYSDAVAALDGSPTLVYDCEERRQWLAPRPSAVKFLYSQFREN